jgi:phosphomannomutase
VSSGQAPAAGPPASHPDATLFDAARAWRAVDPDPRTVAELDALLVARDVDALRERFGASLRFGTAGLRGALGAGPNRMNRVVVRRAARGLAATLPAGARVVVAHDARHGSAEFAADTAAVVASTGRVASLLAGPVPTPLLAFAVRHLGADAGVMVTASHNPPQDNGYKVYLADGAQIVPPHDRIIEASIEAAGLPARELPAPAAGGRVEHVDGSIVDAYLDATLPGVAARADVAALRVVYTPLHGVGLEVARRALARIGCAPRVVASQAAPDPDFPTVAFPNPEEPGALDLALALARETDADLLLANDPDADRLCVAVRDRDGRHVVLSGDDLGVLLGDHRLRTTTGSDRLVVTTVVSSGMLAEIAAAAGVHFAETLTGFKWVVRPAMTDPSLHFVHGYEEALGYAVNDVVRDKDGISAAVATVAMAADLRAAGSSLLDRLDELAAVHGRYHRATASVRFEGAGASGHMAERMAALRAAPPASLAGRVVREVVDFLPGHAGLPPADLLRYVLDGARVQLRPSGTEPKLKVYVETLGEADGSAADALVVAARALVT